MDAAPVPTQTHLRAAEEILRAISKVLSISGVVHPEIAVMSATLLVSDKCPVCDWNRK
jgi:hypothetical protein